MIKKELDSINETPSKRCNNETEVYSRTVGFYRPVKQWNPGKQAEFKDRKVYKINSDS